MERQRQNNKSLEGGGILTDDENKRFALCESDVDGWQPSGRSSDALQTHKSESGHHGDTQAGIITLFVLLCVRETWSRHANIHSEPWVTRAKRCNAL